MNREQVKYATDRLNKIKRAKIAEIERLTKIETIRLNDDQKVEAINSDEFYIKPKSGTSHYVSSWYNRIVFNDEQLVDRNQELYTKLINNIDLEFQNIMDNLILGDATAALDAIRAFAEYKLI